MHQNCDGAKGETDEDMTSEELADRRTRISEVAVGSDNRVRDFINLVAKMCADRTRDRKGRVDSAQARGRFRPHGHEPFEVHQRSGDEGQVSIG
jgi:hypothetical protein